jgi:hypothetical protein
MGVDEEDKWQVEPAWAKDWDEDEVDVMKVEINAEKREAEAREERREVRSRLIPRRAAPPPQQALRDLSLPPPASQRAAAAMPGTKSSLPPPVRQIPSDLNTRGDVPTNRPSHGGWGTVVAPPTRGYLRQQPPPRNATNPSGQGNAESATRGGRGSKALGKALETPISFPAQMAMGMILKLAPNPRQVIREAYRRAE